MGHSDPSSLVGNLVIGNYLNLAYNDEGEGLTIVCLHAIGHDAGDFTKLRTSLNRCPYLETPEEFEVAVLTFLEEIKHYAARATHC